MESIVYAMDWNQARENVVAGASWFEAGASGAEVIDQLRKPTALVCSSRGADKLALAGGRRKRDDLLLDMIRSSLVKGGTVLIPTDSSARVLELAYVLEHAWREASENSESDSVLTGAKLYLADKKAGMTMKYARSMLEWMDQGIVREFEEGEKGNAGSSHKKSDSQSSRNMNGHGRDGKAGQTEAKAVGPFDFKYLKFLEQKSKLLRVLASEEPRVIIASDSTLDWGFSKDILRSVARSPENLIILTERIVSAGDSRRDAGLGLGETFWQWYEERRDGVALESNSAGEQLEQVHTGGRELRIVDVERTPLESNELLLYQQYTATQRHLQNTMQSRSDTNIDNQADVVDDASSSSSSEESDSEQQGRALTFSAALAHSARNKLGLSDEELGVNILLRRKGVYDYDVRGKKGRERMFPYVVTRKREDDYGELIRPDEYLRAEEREEIEDQARESGPRGETKLGQKRKWDEVGGPSSSTGRGTSNGTSKRHQITGTAPQSGNGHIELNGESEPNVVDDSDSSDEETAEELFEGPSKVVSASSTVNVNARIAYVDFSGLHDKRSLEMLIPLIQPQKLILVGGLKDETVALANGCRDLLGAKIGAESTESAVEIFSPVVGEVVDASVDTNAWILKLSRSLVKRLHWQNVRDLGIVALTGQLKAAELNVKVDSVESSKKRQKVMNGESEPTDVQDSATSAGKDLPPTLDLLPANMAAATRSVAQPLHVGDLRLTDLRRLMQTAGHTAEFRGEGTLLIDGYVAVRKAGTGKIEVEGGALSAVNPAISRYDGSFFAVKRKIYEGLAVVAGS